MNFGIVSIADATIASPQPLQCAAGRFDMPLFQSQTRRLLPRNSFILESPSGSFLGFQSQTRRLLPRNFAASHQEARLLCFNRRRDDCFPATSVGGGTQESDYVSIADATIASPQLMYSQSLHISISSF